MEIHRVTLSGCGRETGTVIVIDVFRAFTTAAAAFGAGAARIIPAAEINQVKGLLRKFPRALSMGEESGLPIPGFNFSNSPSQFEEEDLAGRTLIQRTSNGTQGLICSLNAANLLASSLVCASATIRLLQHIDPDSLTLVETGRYSGGHGSEDIACGDLIEKRLTGQFVDLKEIAAMARGSSTARPFLDPAQIFHPKEDLEFALQIDKYDFAMQVFIEDGIPTLRRMDI
jgi:2-phosphosulfolactate phosphatase